MQPLTISRPFEQWGIRVIEDINLNLLKQYKYILTTIDYFTRWYKAIPLTHVNDKVEIFFLEKHIITIFWVPSVLVFDNVGYFSSTLLIEFDLDKGIILRYYSN